MDRGSQTLIVMLMAGNGKRFRDGGFTNLPKWALVPPWTDHSLLELSLRGLVLNRPDAHVCFVAQESDLRTVSPTRTLRDLKLPFTKQVALDKVLRGPLESLMSAWPLPCDYREVFIQVCDTFIPTVPPVRIGADFFGIAYCFDHDKEHFCHVDFEPVTGEIFNLREKTGAVSTNGSCGLFLIRNVPQFEIAANRILKAPAGRASGEYYISDVVKLLIAQGHKFKAEILPGAFAVGTPQEMLEPKPNK